MLKIPKNFENIKKLIITIFFCSCYFSCSANSLSVNGSTPQFDLKRSSTINWQTDTSMELSADIVTASTYKITVQVSSFNEPVWQGRYLRLQINNQPDWLSISPLASFYRVTLVNNGSLISNAFTLVDNLEPGLHPYVPLNYECWASKTAIPGTSQLTITFTLIAQ